MIATSPSRRCASAGHVVSKEVTILKTACLLYRRRSTVQTLQQRTAISPNFA